MVFSFHNLGYIKIQIKEVNAIIVDDDDESFTDTLVLFAFSNQAVDLYHHPEYFLKKISQYKKQTKIFIDNNFNNSCLTGLDIAKKLHEQGYENLYILSGEIFSSGKIPSSVNNSIIFRY